MQPMDGTLPPLRPVPLPRPTIGVRFAAAYFTIAATSSTVFTITTTAGTPLRAAVPS